MLPGESLHQLARLIYPQDSLMQRRFINAAIRENPATFTEFSAARKFDRETLIWLPDLKQLANLATSSPRHFLRPVLPAMQPSVSGAQPTPLKLSAALELQPAVPVQKQPEAAGGIKLAPADNIRHVNAAPAYDAGAVAEIEALIARNQALKDEQAKLDARIAELEANIVAAREAIARDRRRSVRRVEPVPSKPAKQLVPPAEAGGTLLSPTPSHLLTLLVIVLIGGGLVWLRRREKPVPPAVPAPVTIPPAPVTRMEVEEIPETAGFAESEPQNRTEKFNPDDSVITVDEIDSVVEEAKVFVALGRGERAIEMLEEYIATHPRASANPWLYLMDIYRGANRKDDFTVLARRFHQTLNVIAPPWEISEQTMMVLPVSLTEFPHILGRLTDTWGTLDAQDFLNHLLQDNRGGERQGFSMEVLQEILLLLAILELRDSLPELRPF